MQMAHGNPQYTPFRRKACAFGLALKDIEKTPTTLYWSLEYISGQLAS
jgi:hypothetical protein